MRFCLVFLAVYFSAAFVPILAVSGVNYLVSPDVMWAGALHEWLLGQGVDQAANVLCGGYAIVVSYPAPKVAAFTCQWIWPDTEPSTGQRGG